MESYIKAKYVDRRFVRRPSDEELRHKVVSLSKQEKRLSSSSEHLPPKPPPPTPKLRAGGASGSRQTGQWREGRERERENILKKEKVRSVVAASPEFYEVNPILNLCCSNCAFSFVVAFASSARCAAASRVCVRVCACHTVCCLSWCRRTMSVPCVPAVAALW